MLMFARRFREYTLLRSLNRTEPQYLHHALLILILCLLTLHLVSPPVLAGTPTPNEVEDVARTLYCPLCIGQRVDSCEIPLCQDMKREIAAQLAEGRTPEEIRDYFVEQYGPVVLGEPPRQGINWLAWVVPFLMLIIAGGYVLIRLRDWTRSGGAAAPLPQEAAPVEDPYAQRVDRELAQWD